MVLHRQALYLPQYVVTCRKQSLNLATFAIEFANINLTDRHVPEKLVQRSDLNLFILPGFKNGIASVVKR